VLYEARHPIGTKARLAFDLLLYTGVRRSDVVRLGPQMERSFAELTPDGKTVEVQKLLFTEAKGRSRITKTHELPILPPLRQSIDATPTGHLVYLVTAFGKPHSAKHSETGSKSGAVRPVSRISARMACASSARSAAPKRVRRNTS
jgi:integrase